MDDKYKQKRLEIEQFFVPENKLGKVAEVLSPSGLFQLNIEKYKAKEGGWDYSRGIVTSTATGKIVADVKRNFSHFWSRWHLHANGNEYFLCGEDYQGYTVVNLDKGLINSYFPESGHNGWGFCWAEAYPSNDSQTLAVEGCYWGAPYEIVFYDFQNPEVLPFSELKRFEDLEKVTGWRDNHIFEFSIEEEFRRSDGKAYSELSEKEQDECTASDYRSKLIRFDTSNHR